MKHRPYTFMYLGKDSDRQRYMVFDATHPIVFKAIQADYKKGICGDVERCALSRALKRFDSGILKVFTGETTAFVVYNITPHTAIRFGIPDSHRDAIVAFDATGFLAPGTYRFKVLSPSKRIGYRVGSNGSNNVSGVVREKTTPLNPIKRTAPTRRVNGK